MKKRIRISLTMLVFALILFACKKEENLKIDGEIQFQITLDNEKSSAENLDAKFVLVTIKNDAGDEVYELEKISLYDFNGYLISKPISLINGNYHLSQFMVLNSDEEVIYACPVEESKYSSLIQNPLPIDFGILQDNVTKLSPEVISVNNSSPEDFGYATFSFNVVETLDFLLGVFVYNDLNLNFELTDYNIEVLNNDLILFSSDMEAITNLIKLPEEYENYKINITKEGYQMYSKELTKEEIGNYSDDPLEIILLNNENNVIIIQPNGETGKDAYIEDYPNYNYNNRNFGSHPELAANAWTVNGIPAVVRGLIEFDLSVITDASLLENAQLYLYAADSTVNCPGHSQLSGSNEWKIQRVITSWDENVVTWNTQPEITTENQVILPASTHSMQDYQVDVTQLIKDIINNPSAGHGFMIRLVNENYYRRILFASSDNEYSSLHPKLVITLKGV